MPLKKFLPRNSPGIDYFLPIDDSEPNGTPYEFRWGFIDNDGIPIEIFNIHCTNDGGGIPQEIEVRITGVLLGNEEVSILGTTYFSGGVGNYGAFTSYGPFYSYGVIEAQEKLTLFKQIEYAVGTVASANNLVLPTKNTVNVSGTTTINLISGTSWAEATRVLLHFAGALTVKHNFAPAGEHQPIQLDGNADVAFTAGSRMEIEKTAAGWRELWRKII